MNADLEGAVPLRSQVLADELTLLFTDIEGSTHLVQQLGPRAYAGVQARHREILRSAFAARAGREVDTQGDSFFVVFDHPADAVAAAVDAQLALAAEAWPAGSSLRVRMGLATDRPTPTAEGYVGVELNRGARVCAAAHGGQILLADSTRAALGFDSAAGAAALVSRDRDPQDLDPGRPNLRDLRLRDLGEHRLKDLRFAEHLWQVLAPGLLDVERYPTTAGELTPRDRIVVVDPAAPPGDPSRVDSRPALLVRSAAETREALLAVVRGDTRTVVFTSEQIRAVAAERPADLGAYRLGRIAEWSQPRYRLDGRFVGLTLMVDQGEAGSRARWAAKEERYVDLGALLAGLADMALVVLGPPGSGKSTLLGRLELDLAIAALRGGATHDRVTFFVELNRYKPESLGAHDALAPSPAEWLAERWAERFPALPPLSALLAESRVLFLLDALNEMPVASDRDFRRGIALWKDWLVRLSEGPSGNRVVFSCRSLDYSAPLSTPALRVPQVRIEPLSDGQVRSFLELYSPARSEGIWSAIAGRPHLEALRSPFVLALLVDQVEVSGEAAKDRAGLFTGFVRQALKREVERGNPLFLGAEAPDAVPLLSSRDILRISQWQWKDDYDLPERGQLFPKLGSLGYGMQEAAEDGGASQVRLDFSAAMNLLNTEVAEDIVKAGLAIAVLDEDPAANEILYRHQLMQEYFAARVLARKPKPELVASPWRAIDVRPTVRELLASLAPADTLPPLPQTGWEETTILAAAMAPDAEAFIRGLMPVNLVVAGRAANTPGVRERLADGLVGDLRQALVSRSRDKDADLRHRIACGKVLGDLGDPRFERHLGPFGAYLLPPFVDVPGGVYTIGEDEPITFDVRGTVHTSSAHLPAHPVAIQPFRIGQFPVTNAEWACFMAAGGYDDARWWDTEDARRWRRGELADEAGKGNSRTWRKRFSTQPGLFQQMEAEGGFPSAEAVERWKRWLTLDEAAFEAALAVHYRAQRQVEPLYWRDGRLNAANQPVVGVSWYEARAYCAWLAAQTGLPIGLPTEVQCEAGVRGAEARKYAWGDGFEPERANTFEARIRRTTPVGVFPEGDGDAGLTDSAGNVFEWTRSSWGALDPSDDTVPQFGYPYDADDGREDVEAPPSAARVVRGGSWFGGHHDARAACRGWDHPFNRVDDQGFRLAIMFPIAPEPPPSFTTPLEPE